MTKRIFLTIAFTFAGLAIPFLGNSIHAENQQNTVLSSKDKKVLEDLHKSNLKEISLCQQAKNKAASSEVQSYADAVLAHHLDADEKVKDIAKRSNFQLKEIRADKLHKKDLDTKTGDEFEKEFIDGMVDDHKKDIKNLEDAQKDLKSQDVKDLVSEILPELKNHLEQATQIQETFKK